jgi:hypothetical protein
MRSSTRYHTLGVGATLVALIGACSSESERTPAIARKPDIGLARQDIAAHAYVDPQPVGSYPASNARINGWIAAGQTDSIRAHAWDIWQSITASVNDSTPTWQTWYSGHELFDSIAQPTATKRPRTMRLPIERPKQFRHALFEGRSKPGARAKIPVDTFERVFAFNRFSRSTAHFIWDNRLNHSTALLLADWTFDALHVPLAQRQALVSADSTDSLSFVTKNVFYFISGTQPSAVPYWAGYDSLHSVPDTTTLPHPPPRFWKQAVAVDPTGKLQPGDSVFLSFNQQPATWLKIVPLSRFYRVTVTAADSANLSQFGAIGGGDDLGFNSDTSATAIIAAARPANIALLVAMHVTGKEIANWTWQSFWWSPNQNDSHGTDRPASIPAPWNNYVMTTAYSMLTAASQPNIAFNPYLETSLSGVTETKIAWSGVTTNCMSCHRRAAVGWSVVPNRDTLSVVAPAYGPAAQVDPGDSLIYILPDPLGRPTATMKTDFLWSVALRAGILQPILSGQAAAIQARARSAGASRTKAPPKR